MFLFAESSWDAMWHDMLFPDIPLAAKILRPIIVYLFLIIGMRLAGKRQLAQLNPFDLIVLLTLSNTVQNAIIGNDNSVTGGLVGAATLMAVNYIVVRFMYSHQKMERIIEGKPVQLMTKGVIHRGRLHHELITRRTGSGGPATRVQFAGRCRPGDFGPRRHHFVLRPHAPRRRNAASRGDQAAGASDAGSESADQQYKILNTMRHLIFLIVLSIIIVAGGYGAVKCLHFYKASGAGSSTPAAMSSDECDYCGLPDGFQNTTKFTADYTDVADSGKPSAAGANDLTAIDVLIEPGETMVKRALEINTKLRSDNPDCFALDAHHVPHITLLQRYVRTADLDKVSAAVNKIVAAENPTAWKLKATGLFSVPSEGQSLTWISVEPSDELRQLQQKLIDAVAPFAVDSGTGVAFVPRQTANRSCNQPSIS